MKTKRLNRDGWGFQNFPYYQLRIDNDDFHGTACVIKLLSGNVQNWDTPKAGKVYVCGPGMTWMTLIPDGVGHIITAMYLPDNSPCEEREHYPKSANREYPISVWYVDVTEGCTCDPDGVIRYTDKYLDYIFTPEGDISISDRDELDAAYESGELTKEQYESALDEGGLIEQLYTKDIKATEARFARIRAYIEQQLTDGYRPMFVYYGCSFSTDVIGPCKSFSGTNGETRKAVYASWSADDALAYALPITGYSDDSDKRYSFRSKGGKTHIVRGIIDPKATGYIYRLPSDTFTKVKGSQWVSYEDVRPIDLIEFRAGELFDRVTWSDEAWKKQKEIYG